jgi:hypothetical protein
LPHWITSPALSAAYPRITDLLTEIGTYLHDEIAGSISASALPMLGSKEFGFIIRAPLLIGDALADVGDDGFEGCSPMLPTFWDRADSFLSMPTSASVGRLSRGSLSVPRRSDPLLKTISLLLLRQHNTKATSRAQS